jgi:hypothetical protein
MAGRGKDRLLGRFSLDRAPFSGYIEMFIPCETLARWFFKGIGVVDHVTSQENE